MNRFRSGHRQSCLLVLLSAVFFSQNVIADWYIGLAPALIDIDADTGSTDPVAVELSAGYEHEYHRMELMLRAGVSDDSLNQLTTDVPFSSSLLYRFIANPHDSFQINLILGYSQVEIESSYINVPDFSETYEGVSWGIGVEDRLDSIPQLKIKADFIQLYRGDRLNINAISVGARYVF